MKSASTNLQANASVMPSLFLSHGAPTLAIEPSAAREFYLGLGDRLPTTPTAIVIASAHWITEPVSVLGGNKPLDTIHDFYGFPDELYEMQYPSPGIGELENTISSLIKNAGLDVRVDHERGLDHGAWVPLKLMYPQANIPVTQISVDPTGSAEHQWQVGRALAPLKKDNVLIIGSGTMTHNLGDVVDFHDGRNDQSEADYVIEFSRWMEARIESRQVEQLLAYREQAPHAVRAHPTPEHIMPFFFALGAAGDDWRGSLIHRSAVYGVINLDSYAFSES
ncbi:MAG: DODA-type extradiol aromatic ring-opening family dioxygenase [Gammaproteobacteria bacterium]